MALLPGEAERYVEKASDMARAWAGEPEKHEKLMQEKPFAEIENTADNLWDVVKYMWEVKHPEAELVDAFQRALGRIYQQAKKDLRAKDKQIRQDYKFEQEMEGLASLLHNRGFVKEAQKLRNIR